MSWTEEAKRLAKQHKLARVKVIFKLDDMDDPPYGELQRWTVCDQCQIDRINAILSEPPSWEDWPRGLKKRGNCTCCGKWRKPAWWGRDPVNDWKCRECSRGEQ